jgi:hypothetical protein
MVARVRGERREGIMGAWEVASMAMAWPCLALHLGFLYMG